MKFSAIASYGVFLLIIISIFTVVIYSWLNKEVLEAVLNFQKPGLDKTCEASLIQLHKVYYAASEGTAEGTELRVGLDEILSL